MILSCSNGFAQEDYYQKLEQECLDMANRGEYAASLEKARELYAAYPENLTAHLVVAFDLINLGRHKDANGYINAAFAIDPTNFYSYFNAAYYYVLEGDVAKAKEYLVESMKLYPEGYPMKDVIDDLHKVGNNTNKAAVFNQLADWYPQHLSTVKERYPSILEVTAAFNKTPEKTRQIADEYAEKFMKLKWPEMAIGVYAYACIWLRSYGQPSESLAAAQAGYNYYRKNGYGANPFQATKLVSEMLDTYATLGNDEKIIDFAEEIFDLSDQLPLHVHDVNALILTAGAYERLNKHEEARKIATAAYQLAEKAGNRHGATAAANMLCIVYNYVIYNTDVNNAVYFGETALQIALKYKFEVLIGSITGNLAVAYGKVNTYEAQAKGAQLYGSLLKIYKDKQMWGEASLTLNNMGAGMYASKGYQYAAEYFEESIELAKRVQGEMSAADKLTYYQSQMSAYEFLAACYAQLGNAEKAYEAIEASRSRVLTERLAKGREVRPGTIADVQNMLAPDEAAIFYDLFTAHEVIILVITKKYSRVLFHTDDSFIGGIKEKYLDRINKEHGERRGQDQTVPASRDTRVIMADFQKVTQLTRKFFERPGMADELLKEYLQGYYKFLILPVLNRLNGIKSLLISPDGVLNYIPFEALQMFNGKYLVENYSLRYLNSAGALRFINERQYAAGRKPLMAMGGAIYEPNTTPAMAINKQHDMNSLVAEVEENKLAGRSQRKAYATLFGNNAMNPLPGTLAEVNSLSQNVPGAQVFTGRDFTENRLKAMSKDGSLKQFKVLHLATHGFVVEEIPDLSGVAMSVFTNEQEGEDGFLNVEEFASLNINADLTVLSACQTALGKIYSGEGVTGLTQSLLIAGSNAALVSLWPVNDTSTSLFMSDLYKESQKGKSYAQVVTELKRKFIKGDYGAEFKHPNFWAPFVYFGR
ncbi:MAG TPA: CHAT domain-containing protein [Cyclobacteriaceae bacterium]|nr:CHAT domain-containing protein [Cyclobacteriaceae bacterium]